MWRAYPFVDKQSTAPKGFQHSGYNWDDGDVCRWLKVKSSRVDRRKEKIAFTGEMGKDVELMGKNDRCVDDLIRNCVCVIWYLLPCYASVGACIGDLDCVAVWLCLLV